LKTVFSRPAGLFAAIRTLWKGWRFFIGRDPRTLPPRSICIAPLSPATLPCGLAGICSFAVVKDAGTAAVLDRLSRAVAAMSGPGPSTDSGIPFDAKRHLGGAEALKSVEETVLALKADEALAEIFFHPEIEETLRSRAAFLEGLLTAEEQWIDIQAGRFSTADLERIMSHLIRLKDAVWALHRDVLSTLDGVREFNGGNEFPLSGESFRKIRKILLLLNALDRLEVRGRDSAGIQAAFSLGDRTILPRILDLLKKEGLHEEFLKRMEPGDTLDGSIHLSDGTPESPNPFLSFTYKKASITGKLGENGAYLKERIRSDRIFRLFLAEPMETEAFLLHTRWASVGSITEDNCHPVNNYTVGPDTRNGPHGPVCLPAREFLRYGMGNWTIDVALNGDIDNYRELREAFENRGKETISSRVTTDTKIIPLQVEKYLDEGQSLKEAFRLAVNDFEGSHAIALQSNLDPGTVYLALKGSGQSLYVGICGDKYLYASEVYGLVEATPRFVKMDGERERVPGDPSTRGQIFILRRAGGGLQGIEAFGYDGHPLRISEANIGQAEITTRDIDRKDYPHYLLKEILEAPLSIRKTLRGRYRIEGGPGAGRVVFNLGGDVLPPRLLEALDEKQIKKIFIIGQGTAAVAGMAIADAFSIYLKGLPLRVEARRATDLSGFLLSESLEDTLVIAVTQSGTTTDTNRAVAMARAKGAHLIAVVNRRQSDITHMAEGVFYTSDGRDIEMAVASTKAFYSQVVAGYLLALYFARRFGTVTDGELLAEVTRLEDIPGLMDRVISIRDEIRLSAWDVVKRKRYWAVVGSGPNKAASDEIRIKLSELCYRTISSDVIEDKKHIDLSAEPLILVCAAGSPPNVVEDIVKDVAIFKAHAASVIVIADGDEDGFRAVSDSVISVPPAAFPASVILNTLAGHLWGYYAACSIHEGSSFFHDFRKRLSEKSLDLDARNCSVYEKIADPDMKALVETWGREFYRLVDSGFFSCLNVETVTNLSLLFKYGSGKLPLEDFWSEFRNKRVSPSPLDMMDIYIGKAIDELARPVDAIRHQAKTVTVGTSRKIAVPRGILFDLMKELGFNVESLSSRNGIAARRIQKAVREVRGYTLYQLHSLDLSGKPGEGTTISIAGRGGISLSMKSRVETPGTLMGTKRIIANTGDLYAGFGKTDKASIVIMPLLGERGLIGHLLLVQVDFRDDMTPPEKRDVLGDKYGKIRELTREYNIPWEDSYLEGFSTAFLLGEGLDGIVGAIRASLGAKGESS